MPQMTRDVAKSLVRQYNEEARLLRSMPQAHSRKRAESAEKMQLIVKTLQASEIPFTREADNGWVFLALVPTPEEEAEKAAQLRQWAAKNQADKLDNAIRDYTYRLKDMIAHCQRELAILESGEYHYLQTSQWSSTAALDLPRLQERIKAMTEDKAAFVDGKYF